jgi:hypothetical protein
LLQRLSSIRCESGERHSPWFGWDACDANDVRDCVVPPDSDGQLKELFRAKVDAEIREQLIRNGTGVVVKFVGKADNAFLAIPA